MEWFRFYNGALNDLKVQRLAPDLFKTWINLLCLASATNRGGLLPSLDETAFALRMSPERAASDIAELVKVGLIDVDDDGNTTPHNWHGRQRKSDDVAGRVADHRNRKQGSKKARNVTRNVTGNNAGNVTGNESNLEYVTSSHAGASAHPRGREQSRAEQRDREKLASASIPPPASQPDDNRESQDSTVILAAELFNDSVGNAVARCAPRIRGEFNGSWDYLAAALKTIKRRLSEPGAKTITDVVAYAMKVAGDYFAEGIPPEAITVAPIPPRDTSGLKYWEPRQYDPAIDHFGGDDDVPPAVGTKSA